MSLPVSDFKTREDWLAWRKKGIGSSDVPAIMGFSPYKKAFEVFQDKTDRVIKVDDGNFATRRGNELEPVARKLFAAAYNIEFDQDETFEPKLYTMADLPFMRTSLDGQSADGRINVEIKYQGKAAHDDAKRGVIPKHHFIQMQHQLLVSNAERAYHVSINEDELVAYTPVERDEQTMDAIIKACTEFWGFVEANRWPSESEDGRLLGMLNRIESINMVIKDLEVEKKFIQAEVFKSDVEVCGPFRINSITRKGNVQYAKVPELKGVDLERYRGPDTVYKTITKG